VANLTTNGDTLVDELGNPLTDEIPGVISAQSLAVGAPVIGAPTLVGGGYVDVPTLSARVIDFGLRALATEADMFRLLSDEPESYLDTVMAPPGGCYLGWAAISIAGPTDAVPSGRKVTLSSTCRRSR
jgi:hypothetical protein